MKIDTMTHLPETLTAIGRLGIVFDDVDLAPPHPSAGLQETPSGPWMTTQFSADLRRHGGRTYMWP